MKKILFVCSGNIFRSLTAELSLKKACHELQLPFQFHSAGTVGRAELKIFPDTAAHLTRLGFDISHHISRKLTPPLLEESDFIIAMGQDHQDFVQKNFGLIAPLFLEVATGEKKAIPDHWEVIPDHETNHEATRRYIEETIDLIHQHSHLLAKRLPLYI